MLFPTLLELSFLKGQISGHMLRVKHSKFLNIQGEPKKENIIMKNGKNMRMGNGLVVENKSKRIA